MSSSGEGMDSGGIARCSRRSGGARRTWTQMEEAVLIAALKDLIVLGWKSDNGFRAGYLGKLADAMKIKYPNTDLKGNPHINSKICSWKKSYYSLNLILSRSGVGFNADGTYVLDVEDDQWDQIVKIDNNARLMRYKSWPYYEDWRIIFGRDRANGEGAEDILDAANQLDDDEPLAFENTGGDYNVSYEEVPENDETADSVSQNHRAAPIPKPKMKKAKQTEEITGVCEVLSDIGRRTDARLATLAERIGYDFDLGKARKDAFELLGQIQGLTYAEKFDACELLAAKTERVEIFMTLCEDGKSAYVQRLLQNQAL